MESAWQECLRCALPQYGLITVEQAGACGLSGDALYRHTTTGQLERILPSVYRLTAQPASWLQSVKALTLWDPESAAASHLTAAALLKLGGFEPGEIHIVSTKRARLLSTAPPEDLGSRAVRP